MNNEERIGRREQVLNLRSTTERIHLLREERIQDMQVLLQRPANEGGVKDDEET